jgi:hypothetical protein
MDERWPKQRPEDWRRPGRQNLGRGGWGVVARALQPGWRPGAAGGGQGVVGGRCTQAKDGASESRCSGRATGGGSIGQERRRWAHGSWRRGSELSDRERGRARGIFLDKEITFVSHPPADGSYVNFCRLALADGNYVISIGFPSS